MYGIGGLHPGATYNVAEHGWALMQPLSVEKCIQAAKTSDHDSLDSVEEHLVDHS
jgi:hypothetical protein